MGLTAKLLLYLVVVVLVDFDAKFSRWNGVMGNPSYVLPSSLNVVPFGEPSSPTIGMQDHQVFESSVVKYEGDGVEEIKKPADYYEPHEDPMVMNRKEYLRTFHGIEDATDEEIEKALREHAPPTEVMDGDNYTRKVIEGGEANGQTPKKNPADVDDDSHGKNYKDEKYPENVRSKYDYLRKRADTDSDLVVHHNKEVDVLLNLGSYFALSDLTPMQFTYNVQGSVYSTKTYQVTAKFEKEEQAQKTQLVMRIMRKIVTPTDASEQSSKGQSKPHKEDKQRIIAKEVRNALDMEGSKGIARVIGFGKIKMDGEMVPAGVFAEPLHSIGSEINFSRVKINKVTAFMYEMTGIVKDLHKDHHYLHGALTGNSIKLYQGEVIVTNLGVAKKIEQLTDDDDEASLSESEEFYKALLAIFDCNYGLYWHNVHDKIEAARREKDFNNWVMDARKININYNVLIGTKTIAYQLDDAVRMCFKSILENGLKSSNPPYDKCRHHLKQGRDQDEIDMALVEFYHH